MSKECWDMLERQEEMSRMNKMTKAEAADAIGHLNDIISILEVLGLVTFKEEEKPIFEVYGSGIHCRIWANGQIEGFPTGCEIINRLPQLLT